MVLVVGVLELRFSIHFFIQVVEVVSGEFGFQMPCESAFWKSFLRAGPRRSVLHRLWIMCLVLGCRREK